VHLRFQWKGLELQRPPRVHPGCIRSKRGDKIRPSGVWEQSSLGRLGHQDSTAVLIARSERSPAEMAVAMRKAVASVDSAIPIFSVSSWPDALSIVTFPARAATLALGVMGGLAAMLAVTGIFGVVSYNVARRMRELGIRVALGARMSGVLRAALGRTMLLMAAARRSA